MIKVLIFLIWLLETANIVSHLYFRIKHRGQAKLLAKYLTSDGNMMTYCIPDYRSNTNASFKFLTEGRRYDKNLMQGGMTLIEYESWGMNVEVIAKQIIEDIKKHDYLPFIISVGLGDQIARLVEQEVPDLTIITIDPLPSDEVLRFGVQVKFRILLPFLNLLVAILGWISQLHLIRTNVPWLCQSVTLYADQLNSITYSKLDVEKYATSVLVLSLEDQLTDKKIVRELYYGVPSSNFIWVDTCRFNTYDGGIIYREKMKDLLYSLY